MKKMLLIAVLMSNGAIFASAYGPIYQEPAVGPRERPNLHTLLPQLGHLPNWPIIKQNNASLQESGAYDAGLMSILNGLIFYYDPQKPGRIKIQRKHPKGVVAENMYEAHGKTVGFVPVYESQQDYAKDPENAEYVWGQPAAQHSDFMVESQPAAESSEKMKKRIVRKRAAGKGRPARRGQGR